MNPKQTALPAELKREFSLQNEVIRQGQANTNLLQMRLSRLVLSTLSDINPANMIYTITPADYSALTNSKYIYEQLKDITQDEAFEFQHEMRRFQTVITMWDERLKEQVIRVIPWFTTAEFVMNVENKVTEMRFKIHEEFLEYVLSKKESGHYTMFQLETLFAMPGWLSFHLYEVLISYESQILKFQKEGKEFGISLRQLRKEIGFDVEYFDKKKRKKTITKYPKPSNAIREINKAIDTINNVLSSMIEDPNGTYTTSFRHKNYYVESIVYTPVKKENDYWYYFSLKTKQKPEEIAPPPRLEQDRSKYVNDLAVLYRKVSKRRYCGAKLENHFGECFDRNVDIALVKKAMSYAFSHTELCLYKEQSEAFARRMIDFAILNQQGEKYPDILFTNAAIWFANSQCNFPPVDKSFRTMLSRWEDDGVDIRTVLTGIVRTYRSCSEPIEQGREVNLYAYATKVIKQCVQEKEPFDSCVAQMDADYFVKVFKSPEELKLAKFNLTKNHAEFVPEQIGLSNLF